MSFGMSPAAPLELQCAKSNRLFINLSFEFISLILRDFSLSSRFFYLEKGTLALPFDKNPKNLREISYENKQNKLKTQVIRTSCKNTAVPLARAILQERLEASGCSCNRFLNFTI
jgi:hypothetical protein